MIRVISSMQRFFLAFIICLALVVSACEQSVFQDVYEIPAEKGWTSQMPLRFPLAAMEGKKPYAISFIVRALPEYAYSNLFLKYTLLDAKQNTLATGIAEVFLSDMRTGEPLGKGFGASNEVCYRLKKGIAFPKAGDYTLVVEQYMRLPKIEGIQGIGVKVEEMQ